MAGQKFINFKSLVLTLAYNGKILKSHAMRLIGDYDQFPQVALWSIKPYAKIMKNYFEVY